MQRACREFLNRVEPLNQVKDQESIYAAVEHYQDQVEEFESALMELREVINLRSERLYDEVGIARQSTYVAMGEWAEVSLRVKEHMKSRGFNLSSERQVGDGLGYVFALPRYRGGHSVRFEIIPEGENGEAAPHSAPDPRTRLSLEASTPDYQERMEQWIVKELRTVRDKPFGS
jgi:hypothetical protein